jgi:hypothetical protein
MTRESDRLESMIMQSPDRAAREKAVMEAKVCGVITGVQEPLSGGFFDFELFSLPYLAILIRSNCNKGYTKLTLHGQLITQTFNHL